MDQALSATFNGLTCSKVRQRLEVLFVHEGERDWKKLAYNSTQRSNEYMQLKYKLSICRRSV